VHRELLGLKELPDLKELQVHKVLLAQMEHKEPPALRVLLEHKALLELKECKVVRAPLELKVL
jgi:hypothetical protein